MRCAKGIRLRYHLDLLASGFQKRSLSNTIKSLTKSLLPEATKPFAGEPFCAPALLLGRSGEVVSRMACMSPFAPLR